MTNLNNIIEILAKQAMGGQQQSNQQGGLGGILGSVLGQLGTNTSGQSSQGGLGDILGSVLGGLTGAQSQQTSNAQNSGFSGGGKSLLIAVLPLILGWIQQQGDLQAALDKLKGQGLSSQVDDWVSTSSGENASVNPEQVQNLFNDADVEQVAQQVNAPKQDVYSAISQVLPQIIDSLTPQAGQTNPQEANADIQQVLNLVSGFLKR
ncbi:YidB family protein [Acinetobacter sp. WCHAc060042]|uniref:YidB family protein n=1 Tax=Acinetobacter sp. WCHAc060042 TaxID=2213016 RepID=UPI000DA65449|nr:YidB family protein [Acinetobacter sp. WCHAc060042]